MNSIYLGILLSKLCFLCDALLGTIGLRGKTERFGVAIMSFLFIFLLFASFHVNAQNYTSIAAGNWTSASTWARAENGGAATPSTNGGWGSVNISHNIVLDGNYTLAYPLTINSGGTLTVNGDFSGGSTINLNGGNLIINGSLSGGTVISLNGGDLTVTGNLSRSGGGHVTVGDNSNLTVNGEVRLEARMQINRGGKAILEESIYVVSSNYLIVAEGNDNNLTKYADLVVKKNIIATGSGDITVNRNGRVVVYGDIIDSGDGGTFLELKSGSQVYVHGDLIFTGGGARITNENSESPFGLYVNGDIENTNGVTNPANLKTFTVNGVDITVPCYNQETCTLPAGTTSNVGDRETLETSNPSFADWVASQPGSPLGIPQPVDLLYFTAALQQNAVKLEWASSRAWDFSHYELERSADGRSFEYLSSIDAEENSDRVVTYSYLDRQPINGISYYRLKAVDIDGSFEYKGLEVVQFAAFASLKVFPNPVSSGKLHIQHQLEGAVKILLIDSSGRRVYAGTMRPGARSIDTSSFQSGFYVLIVEGDNSNQVQKAQVIIP